MTRVGSASPARGGAHSHVAEFPAPTSPLGTAFTAIGGVQIGMRNRQ